MKKFAERLKSYREGLKEKNAMWTQEYVAKKIGMARTTYTAYENGTKMPPFDTINRIADLFEIKTDYLMGRTDNPHLTEDEEFQAFANDPELGRWYRELPDSDEEDLRKLRQMWEIIRSDKNK